MSLAQTQNNLFDNSQAQRVDSTP